jgi:hypothetical protein
MKNSFYCSFLFIVLTTVSCEKTLIKTGNIVGVVKDSTTGELIANADVFLLQNEIGDGDIWNGGGPSEQIDYVTSDANGNFMFTFDYDKNYRYLCGAEKDLYFDLDQEFAVDEDAKDGVNVEVLLNPVAYISMHLQAINEYEVSDYISVSNLYSTFYGSDIDTNLIFTVQGNIDNKIVWFIYIDGSAEGSESLDVYCPAFDTTFVEILY